MLTHRDYAGPHRRVSFLAWDRDLGNVGQKLSGHGCAGEDHDAGADVGDELEVGVVVQHDKVPRFGNRGHEPVHEREGPMLATGGESGLDLKGPSVIGLGRGHGRE